METSLKKKRRKFGEHLTNVDIFKKFVLPEIKGKLNQYLWVDLFCGEGNLILPILEAIPPQERIEFFYNHIYLFDVQKEMIEKSVAKAIDYGIPETLAREKILLRDTIKDYPKFLLKQKYPVFHITNPPYLYLGYIVKHAETKHYLEYFKAENEGYQDLYQLALINDLRHNIEKMIYIIPSNFLFGNSISNKIRDDFFQFYTIEKTYIFEQKIFDFTGVNVLIAFFNRKLNPNKEKIVFEGIKINRQQKKRTYVLNPKNHFRAGGDFEYFVKNFKASEKIKFKYYLTIDQVLENKGKKELLVLDANNFDGKEYKKIKIYVNQFLFEKIKSNVLFIRTIDTGSMDGRAGLYEIKKVFETDGILVTKNKYRTHPIQIFFENNLSIKLQILLKDYFNLVLEYFRQLTDSEFLTTYKYSDSLYTRKYLGLSQARQIIETFPYFDLNDFDRKKFENIVSKKNAKELIEFLYNYKKKYTLWD